MEESNVQRIDLKRQGSKCRQWICSALKVFVMVWASLILVLACQAPASKPTVNRTSQPPRPEVPNLPPDPDVKRVLVVINETSPDAMIVGPYYVAKRQIPKSNVLFLKLPVDYRFPEVDFERKIAQPIRAKIKELGDSIDFIVTTKGFPIAFTGEERRYSVDAWIAVMNRKLEPMPQSFQRQDIERVISPYFNKNESFSAKTYGMYLVTRIDGFSIDDCKRLVDNSLLAKRESGPFLLDNDPTKPNTTYSLLPEALKKAAAILETKKFEVVHDDSAVFRSLSEPLMGYVSWGSNDSRFDKITYRGIRFKPGSIAETFVSTSARRITPEETGQSMIGDLVKSGVTGVKGYVSEPFTVALARPDILFDRYTSGFNLAESFYMASPLLKWKDLIIGDPLCAPYKKR